MKQDDEGSTERVVYPDPVQDPLKWMLDNQIPHYDWTRDEIVGQPDRDKAPEEMPASVDKIIKVISGAIVTCVGVFFVLLVIVGIYKLLGVIF